MKDYMRKYSLWLSSDYFNEETKEELKKIEQDEKEIEDRFYKDLEFGTGGLRGIIGAGTNRMNIYTVRKASQGLATYISSLGEGFKKRGIVIAYDSRYMSPEFALEAALVLAANGITIFLFDELKPVPELSFAVRHLNAAGGIVITASHNPKEYNGYKVYGKDGAQLSLGPSESVLNEVNKIADITSIKTMIKEEAISKGLLQYIGNEIDDNYIEKLKTLSINRELIQKVKDSFKIIYTPIHGTGNKPVRRILGEIGFNKVLIVKEQENPDSDFKTVKSPNPEEIEAFDLAIELAKKEDVDLIIGTDPDCDRVGVVIRKLNNEYQVLTGNQIGCILLEYILSQKSLSHDLPQNGFVVKTIVSSELSRVIAEYYKVELVEVLTGFKFIGEKIKELDELGDKKFLFGYEESHGYLAGTYSRDKDGVVACMLIAEVAAFYKSKGMTLHEGLIELYEKFGYSLEDVTSFTLKGKDGLDRIKHTMNELRKNRAVNFGNTIIARTRDYVESKAYSFVNGGVTNLELPKSDVLYYEVNDGSWFCVRPSGTEPKIKVYYGVSGKSFEESKEKLKTLKENVLSVVERLLYPVA